jgi:hypothetical protein
MFWLNKGIIMGYTSFLDNASLKAADILTRELTGSNDSGASWEFIDKATKGNVFYAVCKFTAPNNAPIFYGVVVQFSRSKGEFGYKELTENCGPYSANAPIRMIDLLDKLAPIDPLDARQSAQWALKWRQKCRENAKRKPKTIVKKGDIVKFSPHGREFELISPAGPRRGWHVKVFGACGSTYRASAVQINRCIVIDPLELIGVDHA